MATVPACSECLHPLTLTMRVDSPNGTLIYRVWTCVPCSESFDEVTFA